ncbi:acyl-CoA dehydrogenase family protein [Paraburkholderia sp.]|jgi:alkylation response protein AidB-like acyl-CoA dehydrogenase|uniref:acyl-CoA dehydrogenase family protein n=1 Tax=Paraburkholderia sp. TaxID=1926495 RepID=UPI002F3E50DE
MNFLLSSEQHEMQRAVERYFDESLDTVALHKLFDDESDSGGHDPKLWSGLAELGVLGINLPEEQGGLGLEMIDLALIAETLGSRAAPVPFIGHVLATLAIAWAGSDTQRARWLPPLLDGSVIAAVGFAGNENENENDPKAASWTVPGAPHAQLFVLGLKDGQLALVERDDQGVAVASRASTDRTRRLGVVTLDHAPHETLPDASAHADRLRDAALILLAADAFGGATRCHEMAVAYAREREQFGQPIGQFQAVKHQLADMVVAVEPARGLHWYAAHAFDHRERDEAARMAALAKAHLADLYVSTARRCVEIHGGMGYTWELDVHIFLRRAMFDHAWMGSPAHHRARAADLAGW